MSKYVLELDILIFAGDLLYKLVPHQEINHDCDSFLFIYPGETGHRGLLDFSEVIISSAFGSDGIGVFLYVF